MIPKSTPEGWRRATYGDALAETDERAGEQTHLPVLSVTKTRGPMLASERFGKMMHGRDLAEVRYPEQFAAKIVADPMLLWDGSIGIQQVVDAGLVSPDYRGSFDRTRRSWHTWFAVPMCCPTIKSAPEGPTFAGIA